MLFRAPATGINSLHPAATRLGPRMDDYNEVEPITGAEVQRFRRAVDSQTMDELLQTFRLELPRDTQVLDNEDIMDRVLDLEEMNWDVTKNLITREQHIREEPTRSVTRWQNVALANANRRQQQVIQSLLARYHASEQYHNRPNRWPNKHFKWIKQTLEMWDSSSIRMDLLHVLIKSCQHQIQGHEMAMEGIREAKDRSKRSELAYHASHNDYFKTLLRILQHEQAKLRERLGPSEGGAHAHSKRPRTDDGEGLTAMLDIVEGLHRRVATLELGFSE